MIYVIMISILPIGYCLYCFCRRYYLTNLLEKRFSIPWQITCKLDILTIEDMVKYGTNCLSDDEHLNLSDKFNKFYIKDFILDKLADKKINKSILILAVYFDITDEEIKEVIKEKNQNPPKI